MKASAAMLAAACLVAGCATTAGLDPTESRSGFDGGRVVNIDGHGAACQRFICTGLGAQWRSTQPDVAMLSVYIFNDIRGIVGAELSIDGQVVKLQKLPGLTNFATAGGVKQSRQVFGAQLQTVRSLVTAKRAWLRVHTTDGYVEDAIVDGTTDSKAVHALARFLAQVDAGAK